MRKGRIMRLLMSCILGLCCVTVCAQNNSEFDKEINKIIKSQFNKKAMMDTYITYMKTIAASDSTLSSIDIDWSPIAEEVVDSLTPKLFALQTELYRKNYTLNELKQMNTFLSSPVGQKMTKLYPYFTEKSLELTSNDENQNMVKKIVLQAIYKIIIQNSGQGNQ